MESSNQNFPPIPPEGQPSFLERLTASVFAKLLVILVLTLFLLIPLAWVQELIDERVARDQEVSREISSKWGGPQIISGPIIGIPYVYQYTTDKKDEKGITNVETHVVSDYVFLAPGKLQVKSQVDPEVRKRGIYQSIVYNAAVDLTGNFGAIDLNKVGLSTADLRWKDAKVFFGITDVKGLKSAPKLTWNGKEFPLQVMNGDVSLFEQNMFAAIDLSDQATAGAFKLKVDIRGSRALTVFPTAEETSVWISGSWANPSFDGGFLPDERKVDDASFSANWHIPSFSRKFPPQWVGAQKQLYSNTDDLTMFPEPYNNTTASSDSQAASTKISTIQDMVQVNFLESVNNYQRTTRVAKYAVLVILLTFASLFFTEIWKKKRVHIIQYVLIGCAMVLFYSLLLALGEHVGFNWSYFIAAVLTTALIATFVYGITKDKKISISFSGILSIFYLFIYFLLQLQDYALLVGTFGILIILALLMRFSLKIDWYQFDKRT